MPADIVQSNTLEALPGMLGLDHIAIAVANLDTASGPYRMLGFVASHPDEEVSSSGVRVRELVHGATTIELLEPLDDTGLVARFLARRGPGLHHLAFRVRDVQASLSALAAQGRGGIEGMARPGRRGTVVAFLPPSDWAGVLIELVEWPAGAPVRPGETRP